MNRLYDSVININGMPYALRKAIMNSAVIKFDDINKMYAEHEQDYWDVRYDFPCVAPPFEKMFFESDIPTKYKLKTGMVDYYMGDKIGVFIDVGINAPNEIFPSSKWIFNMMFIIQVKKDIKPILTLVLGVTENGKIEEINGNICGEACLMDSNWKSLPLDPNNYMDYIKAIKTFFLHPVLLALSFMHCKNVIINEHNPRDIEHKKSIRDSRGHLKKKTPQTKYYTLDIGPAKDILKTEGNIDEVGLQRALHICRGHFKDYSKGNGLFGKYKGLYWWDSTVRGSEEAGKIEKDYNIKL